MFIFSLSVIFCHLLAESPSPSGDDVIYEQPLMSKFAQGSHRLKQIYFAKMFHNAVTHQPNLGFMKAYFFSRRIFHTLDE